MNLHSNRPFNILLVEDSEPDIELTKIALEELEIKNDLTVLEDGEKAINYLNDIAESKTIKLDIILLDLNLPIKSGFDVLEFVKTQETLRSIPVIILSTSDSEKDIRTCYELLANSYLTKAVDLSGFLKLMEKIKDYWLSTVKLPTRVGNNYESIID